ncbi:MAG TPA: ATP-binding protein [Actinomycetota bacterium]|nr:ATP-binding protein [Actinomycetota bacterium]
MASASDVLDILPDAVVVLGPGPRIEYLNRAAEGLLSTSAEKALGRPSGEVFVLRDSSGRRLDECLPLGRRSPISRGIPEGDYELARSGGYLPVSLLAAYQKAPDGTVERVVLTMRSARARRGMDLRTVELISTVSHEIRSPLTSVKGFTQTLLKRWDLFDDTAKREMLAAVNEDADRVKRLIDELLDVSRLESGRLKLNLQAVDVPALVTKVTERMRDRSGEHSLETEGDPDVPSVQADPDKVEQVVTNLVENALKYTDGGRVTVRTRASSNGVSVSVSDEGEGIPAVHLSRLFRKFYRRDRAGSPTGTGLGLYISRRLIESHGGELVATSEPGAGSTFTFTLPVEGPT